MNTRSFYSFILISCAFISTAMAQANLLNARVPQEIGQLNDQQIEANDETPLAYGYIDDRDILWSKTIWEIVDLDERINFPFYYPTDTLNLGPDRRSLFHVLKKNLRNGNIKEVYDDDYFQSKLTYQEILDKLVAIDTLEAGITVNNRKLNLERANIKYIKSTLELSSGCLNLSKDFIDKYALTIENSFLFNISEDQENYYVNNFTPLLDATKCYSPQSVGGVNADNIT